MARKLTLGPQARRKARARRGLTNLKDPGQVRKARSLGLLPSHGQKAAKQARPKPKPLTAHQRQVKRDDANPLYNPSAQLQGHQLRQVAEAQTRAEIAPQRRALEQQRTDVTRQGNALVGKADAYYRDMADREANAVAQQAALQQRVGQQVEAASQASKTQIDQSGQQASQGVAQAQSLTGVDAGAQKAVATETQAAQSNQALQAQSESSQAANTAGNYGGLQSTIGQARQLQGGDVKGQLLNRLQTSRNKLTQDISNLKSTRGDLNLKNLSTLRQASFENRATVAGLGLKQADLEQKSASDAANRKLALKKQRDAEKNNAANRKVTLHGQKVTARGQDKSAAQRAADRRQRAADNAANRAAKGNGKGRAETAGSHKTKNAVDNARGSIRQYRAQGLTGAQISKRARKAGIPPVVLNAARDLEYLGYLSGPNIAALRRAGVRIPREWLRRPHTGRAGRTAGSAGRIVSGLGL